MDSIPTRGNEIFIYMYIFISSFWCRRWVPPFNTPCTLSGFRGKWERSLLTLALLSAYSTVCRIYHTASNKSAILLFTVFTSLITIKIVYPDDPEVCPLALTYILNILIIYSYRDWKNNVDKIYFSVIILNIIWEITFFYYYY